MSAQQSSPAAQPPVGDGESGSDGAREGRHQPTDGAAASEPNNPLATADLADLLAHGQWSDGTAQYAGAAGTDAYDGHVALALDTGVFPDIDITHDLLVSSHHLFDVPALDVSSGPDDTSSA